VIEVEQIISLYRQRKDELATVQAKRIQVRDAYNGELTVPLPDMGRDVKAAVANLLNTGLDQLAMRVSSTLPSIYCPPRDEKKKGEVTAADKRKKALYGWWECNDLQMMVPRRARQLLAYAQSPVVITPDFEKYIPRWHMRDPLGTYPAASLNPGELTPHDCIFAYTKTIGWLKHHHPDVFTRLYRRQHARLDDRITVLDYFDHDEQVQLVLGMCPEDALLSSAYPLTSGYGFVGSSRYEVLERIGNRAGICTVVVPGRITLDKMLGQFDGLLNMYAMQARLAALEMIAVEKGIFPDTYLISHPNRTAQFISGPHDGRTGKINVVKDGDIKEIATNAGFQTNPTIDRLERAQRLTAGIPAEFGGESASNVRTGRRGDAVLSAAVDFPVQEQQKVLAASLREENRRAIAVAKGYFGSRSQSFYVNWKGARGQVDYVANDIFTTDHNVVEYSHVGSDLNGLTIMVGQLIGTGLMSKQTGAELLPIIDDPEREHDRGIKEALESALLASIQQKVNEGSIAPVDAAWLMQQVGHNKLELPEAVMKLEQRVRERQASMPDPTLDPNADPSQMAGLATGTPAEAQAVPAQIAGPTDSMQNLGDLLGSLRRPQMTLAAERPAVA
jgi:hypothetical protein